MKLTDLTPLTTYAESMHKDITYVLSLALDHGFDLFYINKSNKTLEYTEMIEFDDPILGLIKTPVNKLNKAEFNRVIVKMGVGDITKIEAKHLASLWLNKEINEYDFFQYFIDHDGTVLELDEPEHIPYSFGIITVQDVYALKEEMSSIDPALQLRQSLNNDEQPPSKTALKVIGLLMLHLAKSPKYASGSNPNKSQIKELLIELSDEFEINGYGLSKVDERLLTDALNYLESQKI